MVHNVCGVAAWWEYVDSASIIRSKTFNHKVPAVTFIGVFVFVI